MNHLSDQKILEKIPSKLLESLKALLTDQTQLNSLVRLAYETRSANDLVFSIPASLSVTGDYIALVAARTHLQENEKQYVSGSWNSWPDVIPPRLDTEPFINGEPLECDYWIVKLRWGKIMTGKLTTQKNWVQISENEIEAYKEFSPYPSIEALKRTDSSELMGWFLFPKKTPQKAIYEVLLKDGRQRVVTWNDSGWSFYQDEIIAYKPIEITEEQE